MGVNQKYFITRGQAGKIKFHSHFPWSNFGSIVRIFKLGNNYDIIYVDVSHKIKNTDYVSTYNL